jgi:hypothetical protein
MAKRDLGLRIRKARAKVESLRRHRESTHHE